MSFSIPVVLLLFKREDAALRIIERFREAGVSKLYILADQGRNEEEMQKAARARAAVERAIDWECEVIKNYAEENRGVYGNIALGAKWVFERSRQQYVWYFARRESNQEYWRRRKFRARRQYHGEDYDQTVLRDGVISAGVSALASDGNDDRSHL